MFAINTICEGIIKTVVNSNLDYKMNQTPYSIQFSIRKKLNRNLNQNCVENKFSEDPTLIEGLRQELLYVRNEYQKLYGFYQLEMEARANVEAELDTVNNIVDKKDETIQKVEIEIRQLKHHLKDLQGKYENKCIECKQLKGEIESVNQDKNAISVAFKSNKQNIKEQNKAFDKKIETLEKKIVELNEFRNQKLSEERDEKIRKRKELKKAKQKSNKIEVEEIKKSEDLKKAHFEEPLVADDENNEPTEDSCDGNRVEHSNVDDKEEFETKLMSTEEKEAFFDKLLDDFKLQLAEVNRPLLESLENKKISGGYIT